jgi:hypothetical protein
MAFQGLEELDRSSKVSLKDKSLIYDRYVKNIWRGAELALQAKRFEMRQQEALGDLNLKLIEDKDGQEPRV